jgi:hypothetical protein
VSGLSKYPVTGVKESTKTPRKNIHSIRLAQNKNLRANNLPFAISSPRTSNIFFRGFIIFRTPSKNNTPPLPSLTLLKNPFRHLPVIPAEAGIQHFQTFMNCLHPGFHRGDD